MDAAAATQRLPWIDLGSEVEQERSRSMCQSTSGVRERA